MWSSNEKCWVPNCPNSKDRTKSTKNFFPLPTSARYKEIWLSLAGKKSSGLEDLIYFCQDHFDPNVIETYMDKFVCLNATATPYFNMPKRVCRTCMSVIMDGDIFSVLSAKVPCTIPVDIKSELLTCRPEPLLQVLSFCIPELNLSYDPLPLACYKCYYNIWVFYIFKLTCNAIEKRNLKTMTPSVYGKLLLCRSCPMTSGYSFHELQEVSPLGIFLKKMFLTNHPIGVVPLKVCVKCWTTLCKLQKFYQQCLDVEQKMQRQSVANLPSPSTSLPTIQDQSLQNHLIDCRSSYPFLLAEQKPIQALPSADTNINPGVIIPTTSIIKCNGKSSNDQRQNNVIAHNSKLELEAVCIEKSEKTETKEYLIQSISPKTTEECTDSHKKVKKGLKAQKNKLHNKAARKSRKNKTWNQENKLKLIRSMRKEYDLCRKNNEFTSRRAPWKMILERVIQSDYQNITFDKLYYVWSRMKISATIHEKDGLDMVDEEVWDMLQIQNAIQKSVCNKNIDNEICKGKVIGAQEGNPSSSIQNAEREDRVLSPSTKMMGNQADVNSSTTKHSTSEENNRNISLSSRKLTFKRTNPNRKNTVTSSMENSSSKMRTGVSSCHWTENEKIRLVKLIKAHYIAMLKNQESIGTGPWRRIIGQISEEGFDGKPSNSLYSAWSKIKKTAVLHENSGQMSFLDHKVLRLLKLFHKTKYCKPSMQKKEVIDNIVKEKETNNGKGQPQIDKDSCRIAREEKLDLISIIRSYGGEVFKKTKNRGMFWPKVLSDFNTKGRNWNMQKLRSCWSNHLISAKQAWADQKEPNEFDKIIIDFMIDVIQKNTDKDIDANIVMTEKVKADGNEVDDSFDEISERLSAASNSSPNTQNDVRSPAMNYHYVSLEDIEKGYKVDVKTKNKDVAVKREFPEKSIFHIESYTSEQVIEILDSDDEN